MLVTIASNNDNDATHFTNFFPEGLMIPKNASIGVVNCSYVLREGYTIQTGINDTFQIKLGNMTGFANVVVAAGSYSTLSDLATAMEAAIATTLGAQSAFIQQCFPVAEQTVTGDDQASKLTIHFIFDLASQGPEAFLTGQNAFLSDVAKITGNEGGYLNLIENSDPAAPGESQVRTSNGTNTEFFLVPSHKNTTSGSYEALFRAEYQSAGKRSMMLLKQSADQLPNVCPIQVVFSAGGNVEIFEMIGGVRTQINHGAQAIAPGNRVEIRIPEVDPSQQQQIVASYFITAGGNTTEIPVVAPGGGRRSISQYDEFIPAIEFTTNSQTGIITTGVAKADAISLYNLTSGGANYVPGDYVSQATSSGAGTGAAFIVNAVDGTGAVTVLEYANTGTGYAGNENLTFAGGNGNGLEIEVTATTPTFAITTGGTGYVQGTTYNLTGGQGQNATFEATTVAAGAITVGTIVNGGEGYVDGDVLTVDGGGGDATITLGNPIVHRNRVTNVRANLIQSPANQRPLVLDREIVVKTDTLNSLINADARYDDPTGDLKIVTGKIESNNRAASNIHIQLKDFGPIESREKGSNGKTVAVVPLGDNTNTASGLFNNELFNIVYHKLQNPEPLNNNELSVRLTDYQSNTLPSLKHPVTITFDIRPDVV